MPPGPVFYGISVVHENFPRGVSSKLPRRVSSLARLAKLRFWGSGVSHFGIFRPTALLPEVRVLFCGTAATLAAVSRSFLKYRAVFSSTWTNAVAPQRGAILK